jgi:hypothetical protein
MHSIIELLVGGFDGFDWVYGEQITTYLVDAVA